MFTEIIRPYEFDFKLGDTLTIVIDNSLTHVVIVGYSSTTLLITIPDRLSS